ncbi:MAG: aspartate aminotransferase family protein, partial [Deltaproteobacteria bacterium]
HEHWGIQPDIMTLAKALGGGLPLGAMVARDYVAEAFGPGDHASTFGGNPISCRAGCVVFEELLERGVLENCQRMGDYLMEGLQDLASDLGRVEEVRGKGLMIGVELQGPWAKDVVRGCLDRGILLNALGEKVLRIVPPLIVSQADCDRFLEVLREVLKGI